ncbi:DUF4233 domain-containing protein [Nocardioides sp. MH1]|uniref:DUF4233 domain-containing protein n=1 Tax=Nocardioides sp. MH1 TaxID=3242490 RepID=UPI0035201683
MTSAKRSLCAAVLSMQAIILGLTTPVMIVIADVAPGTALPIGLGLAAVCLVAAGSLRTAWGYWLGHLVQVASVALGLLVPFMFVLGPIFALLWGSAYGVGRKIERERAEAFAAAEESPGPVDHTSEIERESDV